MSWFELSDETLQGVQDESVAQVSEFKLLESGAYICDIDKAYLRKTDSGAEMFELVLKTEDNQNIKWSTCTRSGDAKGNKATWTVTNNHSENVQKRYGVGTEVPLPGYQDLAQLFAAFGSTLKEHQPTLTKVEHKAGETIDAKVFKSLAGKKVMACVRQHENEYNGEISIKVEVELFLDTNGNNSKGEEVKSKFIAKIEKSPIKLLKKPQEAAQPAQADVASTGW